jgi:hypothetical protein
MSFSLSDYHYPKSPKALIVIILPLGREALEITSNWSIGAVEIAS